MVSSSLNRYGFPIDQSSNVWYSSQLLRWIHSLKPKGSFSCNVDEMGSFLSTPVSIFNRIRKHDQNLDAIWSRWMPAPNGIHRDQWIPNIEMNTPVLWGSPANVHPWTTWKRQCRFFWRRDEFPPPMGFILVECRIWIPASNGVHFQARLPAHPSLATESATQNAVCREQEMNSRVQWDSFSFVCSSSVEKCKKLKVIWKFSWNKHRRRLKVHRVKTQSTTTDRRRL